MIPVVSKKEIRVRAQAPAGFQKGSFRTITLGRKIKAIIGRPRGSKKTAIQALRFDRSRWTPSEAVKWFEKNKNKLRAGMITNPCPRGGSMPTKNPKTKKEPVLLLDSARGVYIPRDFIKYFHGQPGWSGVKSDDAAELKAGPEAPFYWDAWSNVLMEARFKDKGITWELYASEGGDLWAIPEGSNPEELFK